MKPKKDLLISITKGSDTKEEYSAYQEEKQKSNVDLKIDLTSNILDKDNFHSTKNVKDNLKNIEYKTFDISTLEKQDILVTQVPNLNEAGFFAGMASLIGYIRKYRKDIKIKGIDPFTDYFFKHDYDLKSEFFADFNTYAKQGVVDYDRYEELYEILQIFEKYIKLTKPKIIGFGLIDGNIDASLFFAEKIKIVFPDIEIILGGCGVGLMGINELSLSVASNNCYDISQYWFVDYIMVGDGEITLIELYESDASTNLYDIMGLVWKKDGRWIINDQRPYTDLTKVPLPDYSDFFGNSYYKKYYDIAIPLTFSRGCNFRCTFCSVPVMVPLYRHKPIEKCLDEIGHWIDLNEDKYEEYSWWEGGWKLGMLAHDSIMNGNPKWLEDLCNGIIDRGYGEKITWGGNLRLMLPLANIDTLRLYNKAGIEYMITGFESASPRVLKHMKKNKNIKMVRKIFENIRQINKEAGDNTNNTIKVQLQLIIGYLNETEEDFQMTLDFIEEFHDVIYEILTCSVFSLWAPLLKQWRQEGEWIEYYSTVVWDTKYNTTVDRIERINRIEKLFDKLGLTYNTYHRGLMLDQYEEYKQLRSKSKTQFGYYNSGKIKSDRELSHWIEKEGSGEHGQ
mgnify:CR=1 FL=1|tara:strand:+ start:151 stop:2013 length:1863 start_codon:yes stop_codon:yes gene_type:complete